MTASEGSGLLAPELLERLAAAVDGEPDSSLLHDLVDLLPEFDAVALEAVPGTPYSRQRLHTAPDLEVMLANWVPGSRCAPHDHGGSSGLVAALRGSFGERRFTWEGPALRVAEEADRSAPAWIGFGPEVIHDMVAPEGGLTLHAYCPSPGRMSVFDLDRQEVLDMVGDLGAWIPDEGDYPRTAFAEAAAAAEHGSEDLPGSAIIWIGHTVLYGSRSDEFAARSAALADELRAADPGVEVHVVPIDGKADFIEEMDRLGTDGRLVAELHLFAEASTYGPMFKTRAWPEQLSPHEWRQLSIPFAPDGRAIIHAPDTARWFAPFFARTFDVPCSALGGGDSPGALVEVLPSPPAGTTSYDRVAELYDAAYVDISVREAEWRWITSHADEVRRELGRPFRIVEIGCGNGALLRGLDDRGDLQAGFGFDDSEAMVGRAKGRSEDRERLEFGQIHGPDIDLPDDSVDVALSFLSFRYLDWDPLLDEIRRVLVPGGRLWVVDMAAQRVRARDLPLLVSSTITHLRMPRRHPQFDRDLHALTSDPDWKTMLDYNPIRAEWEYRGFLESRFPGHRIEVLTATRSTQVIAFDAGPIDKGPGARSQP